MITFPPNFYSILASQYCCWNDWCDFNFYFCVSSLCSLEVVRVFSLNLVIWSFTMLCLLVWEVFHSLLLGTHLGGPFSWEILVFQKYTSVISPSVFSVLSGTPIIWMLNFLDWLPSFIFYLLIPSLLSFLFCFLGNLFNVSSNLSTVFSPYFLSFYLVTEFSF